MLTARQLARFEVDDVGVVSANQRDSPTIFTESICIGLPAKEDFRPLAAAVSKRRRGRGDVEYRVGVGALTGPPPVRVLGYAELLMRTFEEVPASARPDRLVVFASGSKTRGYVAQSDAMAAATLGLALRGLGFEAPIVLSASLPQTELADAPLVAQVEAQMDDRLVSWINRAGDSRVSVRTPLEYAIEHSAPSMFADQEVDDGRGVRVTLGGATEARFWAVRRAVREGLTATGRRVAPALALIIRSVKVPWYHVTAMEPALTSMDGTEVRCEEALATLSHAANPKNNGNTGLKAEYRAARRAIPTLLKSKGHAGIDAIIAAATSPRLIPSLARAACISLDGALSGTVE